MLTVVSLLAGAGGGDLGFRQAGFATAGAIELRTSAAQTLATNFGIPLQHEQIEGAEPAVFCRAIRTMDFTRLARGDVLVGGPPCQDFSIVRGEQRVGVQPQRGQLYRSVLDALALVQPLFFVFENVQGLVSSNQGADFRLVVAGWQQIAAHHQTLGWSSSAVSNATILFCGIVDATALGIAQTCRRLIIIGVRPDAIRHVPVKRTHGQVMCQQVLTGYAFSFRVFPLTALELFEGAALSSLDSVYQSIMERYRDGSSFIQDAAESVIPAYLRGLG